MKKKNTNYIIKTKRNDEKDREQNKNNKANQHVYSKKIKQFFFIL